MEKNIVAVVPIGDTKLIVWFEGGISKLYDARELGVTSRELNDGARVTTDGAAIEWDADISVSSDEIYDQGSAIDFVHKEKQRLLRALSGIRRDASFSQTRLGEAAGIRQSVISRIEGCEISPQINTLLKLLAPLGKTLAIVDIEDVQ